MSKTFSLNSLKASTSLVALCGSVQQKDFLDPRA